MIMYYSQVVSGVDKVHKNQEREKILYSTYILIIVMIIHISIYILSSF